MVRERKCILCHIVYSSKKEMDNHMRSMLHHRELENLKGRDCSHECRVCRVTVVGLSTYAKHISSQLHKDNVDALDKEEEKEEAEEEYFDKELVQLINQRKEQSRQEEARRLSKQQETDRYQRIRDDRVTFENMGPQDWKHRDSSERNWQWQNECFTNPRQGNFPQPFLNLNPNRHLTGPRGRAGWHLNGPINHHMISGNSGGTWHSNAGGPTSWHHRGTGRNLHWYPDGNGSFPNSHPINCGVNWQTNPYGANQWNFSGAAEPFPQGRNRPLWNCDSTQENESGWNNCTSNNFVKERFTWKKTTGNNNKAKPNSNKKKSEKKEDFTSDILPEDSLFEKSDKSNKTKSAPCPVKNNSLPRDKPYRWTPYPSQKVSETQETLPKNVETDISIQSAEARNEDEKTEKSENIPKPEVSGDKNIHDPSDDLTSGKKTEQSELKTNRMPSLKSPLRSIPDTKVSSFKRDSRSPLKGVKLLFPTTVGERQNRLSALNLETIRSNPYISKLRSACKNIKINHVPQDSQKEPTETLGEVLRKAKEMLQNSQSIQSPYIHPKKDDLNRQETVTTGVSKDPKNVEEAAEDTNKNGQDDHFSDNGGKVDNVLGYDIIYPVDNNCDVSANCGQSVARPIEHFSTNSDDDTLPVPSTSSQFYPQQDTEPLDKEESQVTPQCQEDQETFENVSDLEQQKTANNSSNPILPELSKLGLPASLQRDLSRHISSRSKTGTNLPEPNLNSARRIRNVSGHRKSETDKDSGLKPTLRQILNASRRNINWEQVIQHVTKKKQELGKGLPRFGIEMVAQVQSEQEGLDFDEETELSFINFNWDRLSASPLGSARKRSLSESSVAVERASIYEMFNGHQSDTFEEGSIPTSQSEQNACSTLMLPPKMDDEDEPVSSALSGAAPSSFPSPETSQSQNRNVQNVSTSTDSPRTLQSACEDVLLGAAGSHMDAGTDSCTSGTEQNDSQGTGKKRRATGDGSCPEIPSLERKTKRRKIRGRKERTQVDQLLSISLREEELNNSLLGVDDNLHQARAALQAAYMEVQRLLVLKQQITMEMSAMRTQRIQILQGLQGSYEPANDIAEDTSSQPQMTPVTSPGNLFNFLVETPPYLSPCTPPPSSLLPAPARVSTPPAFQPLPVSTTFPDSSVQIKQEPVSPDKGDENMISTPAHPSLFPETSGAIEQNTSVYPVITASMSLSELHDKIPSTSMGSSLNRPRISNSSSPMLLCSPASPKAEMSNPENREMLLDSSPQCQSLPLTTDTSNCSAVPPQEQQTGSTQINNEVKAGKKKKKLRKKKTLRAVHVPENSDTEQDTYADKPVRKVRGRRMSKEITVSTSTSVEQELDATSQETERNKDDNDSDSNVELVEIPQPQFEVVPIDSQSEDEKPDSPSKTDPVSSKHDHSEANDEVTSTSELGTNYMEETMMRAIIRTWEDEEPTEGSFEGHKASVNAIQIFGGLLYTCSADKTVRVYNIMTRQCVGVFEGHTSKVNCLLVAQTNGKTATLFTGSSDHSIRCYSVKTREFLEQLELGERVLCLHIRWRILYAGLANGNVVTFSVKNNKQIDMFECHGPRAVSCLATAQEGARRLLLVGSYDCTISVRDARNGLLLRTLEGHTKTVLCMKVVNDLVFSGSSDQSVHAHNIHTGELVRIYKGHNHAVTVVNILGKVMVTASLDKFVRIYELQSHDRLQVYGGHSDMIMCMAIHKSMIYTGCYDGSVQAVRLNLLQNYRCWWHGCSLIFGVAEHLKQHLLTDHTNPNFQTLKCRWKSCDAFFTARRGSKQDALGHIERHAEEDSRIKT